MQFSFSLLFLVSMWRNFCLKFPVFQKKSYKNGHLNRPLRYRIESKNRKQKSKAFGFFLLQITDNLIHAKIYCSKSLHFVISNIQIQFGQKSIFWAKNRNIGQKSICWSKIEILSKMKIFSKKWKFSVKKWWFCSLNFLRCCQIFPKISIFCAKKSFLNNLVTLTN